MAMAADDPRRSITPGRRVTDSPLMPLRRPLGIASAAWGQMSMLRDGTAAATCYEDKAGCCRRPPEWADGSDYGRATRRAASAAYYCCFAPGFILE